MTETRWDRLAADLKDAGIDVTVDSRPYSEAVGGRVRHGRTNSVTIRTSAGLVQIGDAWWRKNPDVWIGWEVWAEDREGIQTRAWPKTKKRSEVVAAVREALAA